MSKQSKKPKNSATFKVERTFQMNLTNTMSTSRLPFLTSRRSIKAKPQPQHSTDMEDYSLQEELEALAGNAFDQAEDPNITPEPIKDTVARWQKLFNIPQNDTVDCIMNHRNNLTRTRVSEDLWDTIRAQKESEGYDREAYEYDLDLQKKKAMLPHLLPALGDSESSIIYLVELSGPLESVEKVQHAAKLDSPPPVVNGESIEDERPVSLCCVDGAAKAEILKWASTEGGGFEPTILVDPRSMH